MSFPLYHIIILALVQGITEFLPISSSGHLALTHMLLEGRQAATLCWEENRTIDIAVHIGTLAAVLLYFRRDLCALCRPGGDLRLPFHVALASLPVIAAGFALQMWKPSFICLLEIMAWMTLIFGLVLWAADRYGKTAKTVSDMDWKGALTIGLSQVLALIPGTSRSGITMTAARALGYSRTEAAKFSLLLAIVAITGAGVLGSIDLARSGDAALGLEAGIAALLAFGSAYAAIVLMMRWLEKYSFTPFALYRIALGTGLLVWIYGFAA